MTIPEKKGIKTVILDTNALMAIGQFGIDVLGEIDKLVDFNYSVAVLDKTVRELKKLIDSGKRGGAAKLGLDLIKAKKIKVIKTSEGYVDDLLVSEAKRGALILTQDKVLKRRVKEVGPVLVIRQKKRVAWG